MRTRPKLHALEINHAFRVLYLYHSLETATAQPIDRKGRGRDRRSCFEGHMAR